ncbi:MAG: hypothetical protein WCT54_05645, partial [Patescibacteria group bacterium]
YTERVGGSNPSASTIAKSRRMSGFLYYLTSAVFIFLPIITFSLFGTTETLKRKPLTEIDPLGLT